MRHEIYQLANSCFSYFFYRDFLTAVVVDHWDDTSALNTMHAKLFLLVACFVHTIRGARGDDGGTIKVELVKESVVGQQLRVEV